MTKPPDSPRAQGYESPPMPVASARRPDAPDHPVVNVDGSSDAEPTVSQLPIARQASAARAGEAEGSAYSLHLSAAEPTSDAHNPQRTSTSPRAGAAPAEGRFPVGSLLAGRYRIVRMLGRGGMGEVYCADDLELGQRVAIKLLPEVWEQDAERLDRLRSEVRLARSVSHPNVCRVYDIGEIEGRRFVSMEYIEGEDLESLLRRIGHLPADKAAELGLQICHGLTAIHESGILHRDLKPANLMLDIRGRIRIADFGLASLVEDRPERSIVQGTPAYMAPEQLAADDVSIQSDLYALGLILYKLLTGRPAFAARTVHELLLMRTEAAPPPPSAQVSGVVPAVDAVVVRCLAPNPSDRPGSAREVAVELAHGTAQGHAAALVVAVASSKLDGTALVEQAGEEVAQRVARAHELIVVELCPYHAGTRASGAGEVELALFEHPGRAVAYALAYQHALAGLARREGVELPVRMGIHVGVRPRPDLGSTSEGPRIEVDAATRELATRLCKLGGPHQILLSRGAFDLARQESLIEPGKIQWLAHGSYELAGMAEPLEVCEVGVEGLAPLHAPRESAFARRRLIQDVVVGWRPSPGMELPKRPHWTMEKKLGEGGFGEVWLAAHAKTRERRVFKFCYDPLRLRALQREITLFRLLKETLGERDDIVRILDWSFEDAPYFIESAYTSGGNLIDWAEAQGGPSAIPLETRLGIVAQVATALAAAHSVGVLHKDVKPANVLMATPEEGRVHAQLGDFGIGALAQKDRLTEAGITALGLTVDATIFGAGGHAQGTRLYMAPEIIEGKPATMQADIYALGVMLYQIAVGDFARALAPGWERDIEDELLRADIAAAVDGDPLQRLGSAAQLAEKIRTLPARRQELVARQQELEARRQELRAREREREEAERTRAALARATRRRKIALAVTAALLLFAGIATVQSLRVAREARAAAVAGETAQQVSSFLVTLFEQADPYADKGRDISAREILDRGKAQIDALADQPEVQAKLLHVMGVVYGNIGRYQESAALLEQAVEKRRALYGERHLAVAESLHGLARTSERLQAFEPAERAARAALDLRHALLGDEHLDTVATRELMADVLAGLGRFQEARPLYENVLAIRRRLLGSDHVLVAQALRANGRVRLDLGEFTAATPLLEEALVILRRLPGDHGVQIARATYFLGVAHLYRDDLTTAESLFVESLDGSRKLLGKDHPLAAETMERLGVVYRRSGRYAQAEQLFRELLDIYRASAGEASPTYAGLLLELALLARVRGDCEEADALSQQSLSLYRQSLPDEHRELAWALNTRAYLLESWNDLAAAERTYREALEMSQRLPNQADAYGLAVFVADLANIYVRLDQPEKAGPLLTQADETLQRLSHEGAWYRAHIDSVRGLYTSKRGDKASAERLLIDSWRWLQQHHGPRRLYTQRALARLIAFYESDGRLNEARKYRAQIDEAACKTPVLPGSDSPP